MVKKQIKYVGPIIGTLVVVIVIIVAALYAFASHINRQAIIDSGMASTTLNATLNADDVKTLKSDLNNAIK